MPSRPRGSLGGRWFRTSTASLAVVLGAVLVMVTALSGTASAEPTADDWYRLRVCESGNNYAINTGNGYYGAYQFDLGTWRSVGGSGYPHQASPAVQDALALTLYRQRGWSPWACARILGLPIRPDVAAAPPPPAPPIGSLDAVQVSGSTATVAGWVVDGNAAANSIQVHIYVNGAGYAFVADNARPDVNAVLGVPGQHGFAENVPLQAGSNNVCAYAIGVNGGNNSLIGCRAVQAALPPTGNVDSMTVAGWNVTANGWAFDPSSPGASNQVHLYVGSTGVATVANLPRPDVNGVIGIPGQHGFSVTGRLSRGPNTVCAYSIVVGAGINTQLPCRTIQGPTPPGGSLDSVTISGSSAIVAGWAVDWNAPGTSIPVHVYVNNVGHAFTANKARADVNAVLGVGGRHGFVESVPLTVGVNTICVNAIGVAAGGNNTLIECRNVSYNGVQAQARQLVAAAPAAAAAVADATPSATTPSAAATEQSVPSPKTAAPGVSARSSLATASAAGSTAPAASSPAPVVAAPPPAAGVTPSGGAAVTSSAAPSTVAATPGATASTAPEPSGSPTPTAAPLATAGFDSLVVSGLTGTLTGWVAGPIGGPATTQIRVSVNGVLHDVRVAAARTDLAGSDGSAPLGFTDVVRLEQGANEVCVYEIDSAGGSRTAPLVCRSATAG